MIKMSRVVVLALAGLMIACATVQASVVVGRDDGWVLLRDETSLAGIAMTNVGAKVKSINPTPNGNIVVEREDTPDGGYIFLLDGSTLAEIARWHAYLPSKSVAVLPNGNIVQGRDTDGWTFLLNGTNLTEIARWQSYLITWKVVGQPDSDVVYIRSDGWTFLLSGSNLTELGRFNPFLPITNVAVQPNGNVVEARSDGWTYLLKAADVSEITRFFASLPVTSLNTQSDGDVVLTRNDGYTWILGANDLSVKAGYEAGIAMKAGAVQPDDDILLMRNDDILLLLKGSDASYTTMQSSFGVANQMAVHPTNGNIYVTNTAGSLYLIDGTDLHHVTADSGYGNVTALAVQPVQSVPPTIGGMKQKPEGENAICTGIVTFSESDYAYIEDVDRTYGIRVYGPGHGLLLNDKATVAGTVQTLPSGERQIALTSAPTYEPDQPAIEPLGLNNKALGGGDYHYNPGPPVSGQQGIAGATGLNNIGLLITTTGKVVEKDTSANPTWFKIDDGSGVSVKVFGPIPTGTPYVTVVGISSCEKDASDNIQRTVIARTIVPQN